MHSKPMGPKGDKGCPGERGPKGDKGDKGEPGISDICPGFFTIPDQTLDTNQKINFLPVVTSTCISFDYDTRDFRCHEGGLFYITASWTTRAEYTTTGAFFIVIAKNGTKIKGLNYTLADAYPDLRSGTPGPLIVSLSPGDTISLFNYGPKTEMITPINNAFDPDNPNAAGTIAFLRVVPSI